VLLSASRPDGACEGIGAYICGLIAMVKVGTLFVRLGDDLNRCGDLSIRRLMDGEGEGERVENNKFCVPAKFGGIGLGGATERPPGPARARLPITAVEGLG
jgi:hypothetical protein